ncbi:MAG TPA: peptide deformylase, partial [Chlamydiales bacterium]|nr:peptide deformylase [Chlamydiales bacterium]
MIKDLCYYGNPILRKRCKEVTDFGDELKQLVQDLCDTTNAHPSYGLAAPQIGAAFRVFVVTYTEMGDDGYPKLTEEPRPYINPKITILDDRVWSHGEGCLSIPGLYAEVERPWHIRIEAQDINGQVFVEEHEGWMARPLLHENDHLNGVLYVDRVTKQ